MTPKHDSKTWLLQVLSFSFSDFVILQCKFLFSRFVLSRELKKGEYWLPWFKIKHGCSEISLSFSDFVISQCNLLFSRYVLSRELKRENIDSYGCSDVSLSFSQVLLYRNAIFANYELICVCFPLHTSIFHLFWSRLQPDGHNSLVRMLSCLVFVVSITEIKIWESGLCHHIEIVMICWKIRVFCFCWEKFPTTK